jgi:hypothetical protein
LANNYINNVLTELDGDKEKTEDEQNTEWYDFSGSKKWWTYYATISFRAVRMFSFKC